jgi:transposase
LTPRAHSSGGKERLGGISKQGDSYIRRLLVIGATAVIRCARQDNTGKTWAAVPLERKPARVVSVVLANKMARIAWAILARHQSYPAPASSQIFPGKYSPRQASTGQPRGCKGGERR